MSDASNPKSVALVVEDEPLVAMEAVDILESGGFTVLEAWNADTALTMLERHGPVKLVFTDVHMPGSMNGFQLARAIRARWPDTAIMVCSGHIKPEGDELPEGAQFIEKPFSTKLVLDTVRDMDGTVATKD